MTSTVKVTETYSKSALLEIYAQKTEAPWVKRASSRKYSVRRHSRAAPRRAVLPPTPPHCPLPRAAPRRAAAAPPYASLAPRHSTASTPGPAQMEAVRSKVPVLVSSTSTGSEHAAVAERV